jgi:uncharacterized protein YchJ
MNEVSRGANRTDFIVQDDNGEPVAVSVKRNDKCFCGSGKKFKRCCLLTMREGQSEML